MTGAKPFDIPKREVWEAFKRVKANQGAAKSTSSGTGCRRAATCPRRSAGWTYRRQAAEHGRWVSRRSPTVSRRRWSDDTWSRCWSLFSTATPTDIVPDGRRSMRSGRLASGAGAPTGCSISTSKASSTASIMSCCSGPCVSTPNAPGRSSTSSAGWDRYARETPKEGANDPSSRPESSNGEASRQNTIRPERESSGRIDDREFPSNGAGFGRTDGSTPPEQGAGAREHDFDAEGARPISGRHDGGRDAGPSGIRRGSSISTPGRSGIVANCLMSCSPHCGRSAMRSASWWPPGAAASAALRPRGTSSAGLGCTAGAAPPA